MIRIYDKNEKEFISNGITVLNSCKSCLTTEELNGQYETEIEHPLDIKEKWKNLIEGNVLKVDGQLFRIYKKNKTLIGIKVFARHVFYDLLDNLIEEIDIRNLSCINALDKGMVNTSFPHNFKYMSDIAATNTIFIDDENGDIINKNPIEVIFKLIEIYGGELNRDNFNFKLLQSIGQDKGILIAYGKNITGIEEDKDESNVITRIKAIGQDGLTLPEKYVDSPNIASFNQPKIKPIEFPDCNDYESLRAAAKKYFTDTKCDFPLVNYKINFVELSKTEEYKHYAILEQVGLGDTVTVKHTKLGLDLKCRVIKIKKNTLTKRIEEVELGDFKKTFADAFSSIGSTLDKVSHEIIRNKNDLNKAIENASNIIKTQLGGHVVKRENELLIMNTEDIMTATQVWRWNLGGLAYSGTGYNGEYRTAITMDGAIVADFITAGVFDGGLLKAGTVKAESLEVSAQMTLDSVKNKVNNEDLEAMHTTISSEITTSAREINTKVESVSEIANTANATADDLKNNTIPKIIERVSSAELKITDESIVSTVTESDKYLQQALSPIESDITVIRNSFSLNPLQFYNYTSGRVFANNELLIVDSGNNELSYNADFQVINNKFITFESTKDSFATQISKVKSSIAQTSDKIDLLVAGTTGDYKIKTAEIMLAVNEDESVIKISADKVDIEGKVTADYIKSLNLQVGEQIIMGPNARIYWENLDAEAQNNLRGYDGMKGADGSSSYLHIKYSDDGITFTSNSGETPGKYMGTYSDFILEDSNTFGDYKWALIKGADGIQGERGLPGINGIDASSYTDARAVAAWVASGYHTYITSDGVYTGEVVAENIVGGTITGVNIHQTYNGVIVGDMGTNENGGIFDVYDINGNLNVHMGSESGSADNIGGTIILYNDGNNYPRAEFGIAKAFDAGIINLKDKNGIVRVALKGASSTTSTSTASLALYNSSGAVKSYIKETSGAINGYSILTTNNISSYAAASDSPTFTGQADFNGTLFYNSEEVATKEYIRAFSIQNNGSYNLTIEQTSSNIALYRDGDTTAWLSLGSTGVLYVHGVRIT